MLSPVSWRILIIVVIAVLALVPICSMLVPEGSPFHLSAYALTLVGKIMCYAIGALALDLVWGYCGILSLGHSLFFALGGYMMGMYLMRSIGLEGVYHRAACGPVSRFAGLALRLLCFSLPSQGCLPLNYHPGHDLCGHAPVLQERDRIWREQRIHRF
jgi:ABC-type branched-subunit amino acid transport system permease subunit